MSHSGTMHEWESFGPSRRVKVPGGWLYQLKTTLTGVRGGTGEGATGVWSHPVFVADVETK